MDLVPLSDNRVKTTNTYTIPTSLKLNSSGVEPTFSVRASNGETMIINGQIGNFRINKDKLSGGKIENSCLGEKNYYETDNTKRYYTDCFCDIEADSDSGLFSLTRMNGKKENFNIAAMVAYQKAVAAAGQVIIVTTKRKTKNGAKYLDIKVTNGLGAEFTKSVKISSCNGNCTGTCKKGCSAKCEDDCTGTCSGSCTSSCGQTCGNTCSGACGGNCKGTCKDGCYGMCTNTCTGTCVGKCYYSVLYG